MLGKLYAIGNAGAGLGPLPGAIGFLIIPGALGATDQPLAPYVGGGSGTDVGAIVNGGFFCCWSAVAFVLVLFSQMEPCKVYKCAG